MNTCPYCGDEIPSDEGICKSCYSVAGFEELQPLDFEFTDLHIITPNYDDED